MSLLRQSVRKGGQLLFANKARCTRALHRTLPRQEHFLNASPEVFQERTAIKDRLVLVDFYADWCGPCKTISPLLEKLTSELKTKEGNSIDLITVDTDAEANMSLAITHKIRALPTVIAFKNGEVVDQFVGAIPEQAIKEFIARQ